MASKTRMADWRETMALREKNLLAKKFCNLFLSETSIGGQLENHRHIKKISKKTSQRSLKVSLFLLKPL